MPVDRLIFRDAEKARNAITLVNSSYGFVPKKHVKVLIAIAKHSLWAQCRNCDMHNEISKACAGCSVDNQKRTVERIERDFNELFSKGDNESSVFDDKAKSSLALDQLPGRQNETLFERKEKE